MTSRKRDFAEFSEAESAAATSESENFVYNPSNPLYAFRFVDELVEQHRSSVKHALPAPDIVCCPRSYEEDFLREPVNDERGCSKNSACQGMLIPCDAPFVLREFFLPGEKREKNNHGLCLMCTRYEIARQFFRSAAGDGMPAAAHVSKYYNSTSVPGEYNIKDCIVNPGKHFGLTLPVVLHVRSAYELRVIDGVKQYTQCHYCDNTRDSASIGPAFLCRGAVLRSREATAHSKQFSASASSTSDTTATT